MLSLRARTCAAVLSMAIQQPHAGAQTAVERPITHSERLKDDPKGCPRGAVGSSVIEPADLRSQNGILRVAFTYRNALDASGRMLFCYIDEHGNQSPTLRLHPGDTLILTLINQVSALSPPSAKELPHAAGNARANQLTTQLDPCSGGIMTSWTTNLHFHGMIIPPVCHQDDTLGTLLQPSSPPFEYRIQIPKNQPPGLYWYHPHIHGFSEDQILGGASGALIVEGIEQAKPQVAGLPERVLIIRDHKMPDLSPTQKLDANTPTKDLSINFTPVPYPKYPPAVIKMKPSERQFWRVLNASADTYLDLQLLFDGKRQVLGLLALDGVPIRFDEENSRDALLWQTHLFLPPAARAEFILNGPPAGVKAIFVTNAVSRGPSDEYNARLPLGAISGARIAAGQDDNDPTRPLIAVVATADAPEPASILLASVNAPEKHTLAPLASVRPLRIRRLYFSEELVDPKDPKSLTVFYITEAGQKPAAFDTHTTAPNIVVHQGDVEDWIIENRSQEPHAFHIHQTHFLPVGLRGVPYEEPTLRDTINLPTWEGEPHPYPSVRLRMDFRNPAIVGTFPYHCHILQHVDAGMMGTIRVDAAQTK